MNQCSFCGNKNFKEKKIQYFYKREDKFLMVNQVPCEECEYCGEQYFEAKVLKKIEDDFDEIYLAGKIPSHQVKLPIEDFLDL